MQKRWSLILMVLLGALAACNAQPTPVLPTLIPSPTNVPAAAATLVPTQEPTQEPIATFELPPTWTLVPTATATTIPASATPLPTMVQITPLAGCSTFAVDLERSVTSFPANTEPVVAWTSVAGAQAYRITLYGQDSFGNLVPLFDGYTADTSYTFTRDLYTFTVGQQYGWEVYPADNSNVQMCTSRGGELAPFTP